MKKDNSIIIFALFGTLILSVFSATVYKNLYPKSSPQTENSGVHKIKVLDEETAYIENIEISENKITIKTLGPAEEFCIKTTKSTPSLNNLCWKKIEDNTGSISIYQNKKYYIWIKDSNNKIISSEEAMFS